MREYQLTAKSGKSRILVGAGASRLGETLQQLAGDRRLLVVADAQVATLHAEKLLGLDTIQITGDESCKTLASIEKLYAEFFSRNLERSALVVAFGGGALCDAVGFAAATYLRGVGYAAIATTLLAQVDASIGGKNGVNFQGIKNLLGTIRQPEFVICDTDILRTLPKRELACGFAEIIKHAAIQNGALFSYLEEHAEQALALVSEVIQHVVYESVAVKAQIVEEDEHEHGSRRKLNFGHTIGHGIEVVHHKPHGEAVALGMVMEAALSTKRALITEDAAARLVNLVQRFGLPVRESIDAHAVYEALLHDKKKAGTSVMMPLLHSLGQSTVQPVPFQEIRSVLEL